MFRNYLKTAWRNITRSIGYSTLNILGLAIGMAVALLIGLWVYYQFSYDKFLPNNERVYQVKRNYDDNGQFLTFNTTSLKLSDALRNQIPEIEYVAECDWMGPHGLIVGDKKFYLPGGQVKENFLKLFEYPLIQGNSDQVLKDPYSIVLTQSTAKTLFGNDNPIGKTVRYDNRHDLKVTGLLKDLPDNSSLRFNFLVPFAYLESNNVNVQQSRAGGYGQNNFQQFVKLKPGVSFAQVSSKIKNIEKTEKNNINAMRSDVILHPMKDWHLYSEFKNGKATGGFIEYVNIFIVIGTLVLLIACINFINLTTARSEKRAREVGVRKAIGSQRKDLIIQFLAESFLLTFLSFALSIILVQLVLPAFHTLTGNELSIPYSNITFWLLMLGCLLVTALIAGSRPAFYLSSFHPVKVLKGLHVTGREGSLPRKALVVLQFSCSIALIISTIIVYRQIQHAKDRPTGINFDRLMVTDTNDDLERNYTALRNELIQQGIVQQMTTASSPATDVWWHSNIDAWPGKMAGETVEMGVVLISDGYFKTLQIPMTEGRDYAGPGDTTNVIFNQTAINRLRIKNPINQIITFNERQLRIVGVAKDALMVSPFAPPDPTMFLYDNTVQGNIMYRLADNIKTQDAITRLTALFNKSNPAFPYKFQFADASYASKFNIEILVGRLAANFSALAIFISCLGLFGLAAYVAEQRTKEIGIRKVLGASVPQLWLLLSKDFLLLVIIGCVIATPVALYFLSNWLQKYEYRVGIGPGVFFAAAGLAIVITVATISFQAIKAAIANPVRSLRSE